MEKLITIKIYEKTKRKLDKMKVVPSESYDSVINRLIKLSSSTIIAYMTSSTVTYNIIPYRGD